MGRIRQMLGLRESAATTALTRVSQLENDLEVAREGFADLELSMEDRGWQALSTNGDNEFSLAGLKRAAKLSRVMAVANPLVKRGLAVRAAYIWGDGVQITASTDGDEDVNAVVQAFLDDPGNQAALTGDQAHAQMERVLGTDGTAYFALFTGPYTGRVQTRSIPLDEIIETICDPDDRDTPWYYKRSWTQQQVTADGRVANVLRTEFYPALNYSPGPGQKFKFIDGYVVNWDAPVLRVKVNDLDGWQYGIGDAYASLPWARLYRDFLTDWAVLVKSLSQFAWKASTGNGSKAAQLRQKLARRPTVGVVPGNENNVGATALMGPDVTLEAIPKSGATIDSESGRPLAAMVAAGLGVPVTMLLADPGQTGARAVAETLDKPTENEMKLRRAVWTDAFRQIILYVIAQAVKAPQGPLQGIVSRDPYTGQETIQVAGSAEAPTVEITWPPLDETPMATIITAIVQADSTGKLPPTEVAKLLLNALGVKDVDAVMDTLTDDQGNWVDPNATVGSATAQAAIDAFRAGADPAEAVR